MCKSYLTAEVRRSKKIIRSSSLSIILLFSSKKLVSALFLSITTSLDIHQNYKYNTSPALRQLLTYWMDSISIAIL